eukprot:scpid111722/ scgid20310/ 
MRGHSQPWFGGMQAALVIFVVINSRTTKSTTVTYYCRRSVDTQSGSSTNVAYFPTGVLPYSTFARQACPEYCIRTTQTLHQMMQVFTHSCVLGIQRVQCKLDIFKL